MSSVLLSARSVARGDRRKAVKSRRRPRPPVRLPSSTASLSDRERVTGQVSREAAGRPAASCRGGACDNGLGDDARHSRRRHQVPSARRITASIRVLRTIPGVHAPSGRRPRRHSAGAGAPIGPVAICSGCRSIGSTPVATLNQNEVGKVEPRRWAAEAASRHRPERTLPLKARGSAAQA